MARKIIQLERVNMPSDSSFRVALWLDVPLARQSFYANAQAVSIVKNISPAELVSIQTGTIVEMVEIVPKEVDGTVKDWRDDAEALYTRRQNELNNRNPFARYGTSWDGAVWTSVTVA